MRPSSHQNFPIFLYYLNESWHLHKEACIWFLPVLSLFISKKVQKNRTDGEKYQSQIYISS